VARVAHLGAVAGTLRRGAADLRRRAACRRTEADRILALQRRVPAPSLSEATSPAVRGWSITPKTCDLRGLLPFIKVPMNFTRVSHEYHMSFEGCVCVWYFPMFFHLDRFLVFLFIFPFCKHHRSNSPC